MARLVIVLDLPDVDATRLDPHDAADDLLDPALPTFGAGGEFLAHVSSWPTTTDPDDEVLAQPGVFVSAEWG